MDLPVIGAHCELEHCRSLDLLPIKCTGCQSLFCRHHIALSSHSCPSLETNRYSLDALQETAPASQRERCAFHGCQKATLESVIVDQTQPERRVVAACPQCAQAYCAAHRHPQDHACTQPPSAPSPAAKNPEAHALLNKHFPATTQSAPPLPARLKNPPTDPKKRARLRAVELMKMRHHALPADPRDRAAAVPLSDRIHFKVVCATAEQTFWLRKAVGTGKALDLIADRFSVRITDSAPVYLEKLSAEDVTRTRLSNDKSLSEQIEDGETVYMSLGTS